jgi:hypothetical protein
MELMRYILALGNLDSGSRGRRIIAALREMGIEAKVQAWRLPRIRNVIADFSSELNVKRLLFCAHYDAVAGSKAANDNASGVAVLLGLCERLRHTRAPVQIVFFDREEAWFRTPLLRLGLLGSTYYVLRRRLRNLHAVYNLEFVGLGNSLGVWPVKGGEVNLSAVKAVAAASARLGIPFRIVHIPWLLLSSDHLPFRLRGFPNSISLSLLPAEAIPALERVLADLSVMRLIKGQRPALPEPLSFIHGTEDSLSRLSEDSLELMLSLLVELIRDYAQSVNLPVVL